MYKNDGKLTEYTKVPAIANAVLYATFKGGKGGEHSQEGGSTIPTEYTPSTASESTGTGFGFKLSDNTFMAGVHTGFNDMGFDEYKLTARAFKKDQTFKLWDFANNVGWTEQVDPYSFNGTSAQSTEWAKYLSVDASEYTVLQDFNAAEIYIKIKFEANQVYFKLGL